MPKRRLFESLTKMMQFTLDYSGSKIVYDGFIYLHFGDNAHVYIEMNPDEFLNGLAEARQGSSVKIVDDWDAAFEIKVSASVDAEGLYCHFNGRSNGSSVGYGGNFDQLFLDTFSVIENSEARMRNGRVVALGPTEKCLIDLISSKPALLHNFSPREFEVAVASFLTNAGFYNVTLKRFTRDGGVDVYAIYCEGDDEYTVVVEVKKWNDRAVGIEVVDRLNGVRARLGADKAAIFTTSRFSIDARRAYSAQSNLMAFVDYQKLEALLGRSERHWTLSPSGLWSLPRAAEKLDSLSPGEAIADKTCQ